MEERLSLVKQLKWVDQVIPNVPYAYTEEFMAMLVHDQKIDYIIHGDDPCCLPDGTDAYAMAKKGGYFKQIKPTEGVSSTDIVERILSAFKSTREPNNQDEPHICGHLSHFLPTSLRIVQFSNGKAPGPHDRVIYIDGAFDLFHAGHVEILEAAKTLGDFLLVGIYADQTISKVRGTRFPLMHLHERVLSVLACRHVDEVILGAPWEITRDMMMTFNIALVVQGTIAESSLCDGQVDPYAIPKSMGKFQTLKSPKNTTTSSLANRIVENYDAYKKRNLTKAESEKRYYTEKIFVQE